MRATTAWITSSSSARRPDYTLTSTLDCSEGRFFNDMESRGGAEVCVIGYDVADALFPGRSPLDKTVLINGQPFKVIGTLSRQGTFLGLFSLDSIVVMPLARVQKIFQRQERGGHARQGEGQNTAGRRATTS